MSDTKIIRFCIFDKVTFEYNTNIISDFDSHYVIHFAYCISKSIYDNPTILLPTIQYNFSLISETNFSNHSVFVGKTYKKV